MTGGLLGSIFMILLAGELSDVPSLTTKVIVRSPWYGMVELSW